MVSSIRKRMISQKIIGLLIAAFIITIMGCSDQKSKTLYETGLFEEKQFNTDHARLLYEEIIKKYPDTPFAQKAKKRLAIINQAESSPETGTTYISKGGGNMSDNDTPKYALFDHPDITMHLFHPRENDTRDDDQFTIAVEDKVVIGAKLHLAGKNAPTILFFHGNGEIVSDYDDLGPIFTREGINLMIADYRGYGQSTGTPRVSSMIRDAHQVFAYTANMLKTEQFTGPLIVMGRSLGSASALELSASYPDRIDGLIIESGFAHAVPLLKLLGVPGSLLTMREEEGFDHIAKIKRYTGPTLIIHAEHDHIIPFSDGRALYDASGSPRKSFLPIPQANHNTIFAYGMTPYLEAINTMIKTLTP